MKSLQNQPQAETWGDVIFSLGFVLGCGVVGLFLLFKFMPDPEASAARTCNPQCHISQGGGESGPWTVERRER
jgi:hypothetical protein